MTASNQDLSSLISAAHDEANRMQRRPLPASGKGTRSAQTVLLASLAGAGLVFAMTQLWPLARPHSADQTARDLDAIVEQARAAVEDRRSVQGRLPEALPNAALAGLVAYTPAENAYQLFAASGTVSVTLDRDGKKTIDQGRQP